MFFVNAFPNLGFLELKSQAEPGTAVHTYTPRTEAEDRDFKANSGYQSGEDGVYLMGLSRSWKSK
jgi:hypothetical protein